MARTIQAGLNLRVRAMGADAIKSVAGGLDRVAQAAERGASVIPEELVQERGGGCAQKPTF